MPVVVISGTVGSGKTTIATEVHDLLAERGYAVALIDVDYLTEAEPRNPSDPYNNNLGHANLASVWPNYRAHGVEYMVLARVVEHADERAKYEASFGMPVQIVRLEAPSDTRKQRLTAREPEGRWREWHLNRTDELADILQTGALEDFVVVNADRTPREVALEVVDRLGW